MSAQPEEGGLPAVWDFVPIEPPAECQVPFEAPPMPAQVGFTGTLPRRRGVIMVLV